MNLSTIMAELRVDEGFRAKPYQDTVGVLTIGYGRNLQDVGISRDEAELLLRHDVFRAIQTAQDVAGSDWVRLSPERQEVIVNMAFNLGRRLAGFKRFRAAIAAGDWHEAAVEMMDSKWAKQVGARADRLRAKWLGEDRTA